MQLAVQKGISEVVEVWIHRPLGHITGACRNQHVDHKRE
jgi:hypothetical protein